MSAGVDDNGSGAAAVLEAARVLKLIHGFCPFTNSVVFVLLDFKHKVASETINICDQ